MDVRFQFSIAIARTEHSSFSEREHAALEGLQEENRLRFSSCKHYLFHRKRPAGGPFPMELLSAARPMIR